MICATIIRSTSVQIYVENKKAKEYYSVRECMERNLQSLYILCDFTFKI